MKKIIFVLLVISSPLLKSATIHIPSEQATLEDAFNVAQNYDTILIASGTYSGTGFQNLHIYDDRNLYIVSEEGAENCIFNITGDFLLLDSDSNQVWEFGEKIFEGFTFQNGSKVFVSGWNGNIVVKNSIFKNNEYGFIIDYPGYGGVENSKFYGNHCGVYLRGAPEFSFHIYYNLFEKNFFALHLSGLNNPIYYNILFDNFVGIYSGITYDQFYRNIIYKNQYAIWSYENFYLIGENNLFYGNDSLFVGSDFLDSIETHYFKNNYYNEDPLFCDSLLQSIGVYPNSILLPENNLYNLRIGNVYEECFYCGDLDWSESAPDISDLVYLVDFMFNNGPPPVLFETSDFDFSQTIDISDLVILVDFMFTNGPELQCQQP